MEQRGNTSYSRQLTQSGGLTTDRCPFFALVTSSSDPGVKSMIPSFPWPTVNFILEEGHSVWSERSETEDASELELMFIWSR